MGDHPVAAHEEYLGQHDLQIGHGAGDEVGQDGHAAPALHRLEVVAGVEPQPVVDGGRSSVMAISTSRFETEKFLGSSMSRMVSAG